MSNTASSTLPVANATAQPPPPPSVLPPIPVGPQATGQVAGSNIAAIPAPVAGVASGMFNSSIVSTTSATTGGFMTTAGGSNVVYVNQYPGKTPRRPRKPKEKRQVPLYTAGLEAKLNKALDQDAAKVLRYISKKVQQPPKISQGVGEDVYEFAEMYTYAIHNAPNFMVTSQSLSTPIQPTITQHTVKFRARLTIREDGTLKEFEIMMGGIKR